MNVTRESEPVVSDPGLPAENGSKVPRRAAAFAAAAVASLGATLGFVPRTDAFLYWSDRGNSTIGRASHLTGAANPDFHASFEPDGMALHGDTLVYGRTWSRASQGVVESFPSIAQVALVGGTDDTDTTELVGQIGEDFVERVEDVEVANGYVYWLMSGPQARIGRANLDGSNVNQQLIVPGLDEDSNNLATGDLAVDGSHVYWSSVLGPSRARLNGSEVEEPFISSPLPDGASGNYGIAVDDTFIYWSANANDGTATELISRARLNGTDVQRRLVEIPPTPEGFNLPAGHLEVDDNHIYSSFGYRIGRANIDGSGLDVDFIALDALDYGGSFLEGADDIEVDSLVGDPGNPPSQRTKRSISINYSARHAGFKGRIRSTVGDCRKDRVRIYRHMKGPDRKAGADLAKANGRWSVGAPSPKPGRYYAKIKKLEPPDLAEPVICSGARSKAERVK